jgi:aminoglycoside phosphotransferase (APT) family kinase protein
MGRPVPEIAAPALDPAVARARLVPLVGRLLGASAGDVEQVTVDRFQRRLLRYTIDLRATHERPASRYHVIGKVYDSAREGELGFECMRGLWDRGFARGEPAHIGVPQPYEYFADLRLMLMEEVPGKPLKRLLKKKVADAGHMRLLADSLAKLHRSGATAGDPFTVEAHLSIRCTGLIEPLGQALPGLRDPLRRIVDAAKETERRAGRDAFATVHGDFHAGQVLIAGDRAWVLDLDRMCFGDPAYDVAMVFFTLKQLGLGLDDAAYVRFLRDAFAAAYFTRMGWQIAGRVAVQEALIHLKRACKRFRWQDEPGWQETIPVQVGHALACVEAMRQVAEPSSVDDVTEIYERCPACA